MAAEHGIPDTIRTGSGAGVDDPAADATAMRLLALVMAMVKRAGDSAGEYAEHAGRTVVLAPDVHLALKYHAQTFLSETTADALDADVADMEDILYATSSSTSDDELATSAEAATDDEPAGEWTRSRCGCAQCLGIHRAEETWDAWDPADPAEANLKRSVDKTIRDTAQINNIGA